MNAAGITRGILRVVVVGLLMLPLMSDTAYAAPPILHMPTGAPVVSGFDGVQDGQRLSGRVAIKALVTGTRIAQVVFELSGPQPASHVERVAPYVFMGDVNGRPRGWDTTLFPDGDYTLTATVTDRAGQSATRSVRFRIANVLDVAGFTGVEEGQAITGTVGIEAIVTTDMITQVVFELSGPQPASHVERVAPYVFMGDVNGQPRGWDTTLLPDGDYTLTATATNRAGQSAARSVRFRIANTSLIYQDTFSRPEGGAIGPDWSVVGEWDIISDTLHSPMGGYGYAATSTLFQQTSAVIETRFKAGQSQGPSPSDRFSLSFGGTVAERLDYQLAYYPWSERLVLIRSEALPSGELTVTQLGETAIALVPDQWYSLKVVRDGASGLIEIYVNQGDGYGLPSIQSADTFYPAIGQVGWIIEREAPTEFYVDWLSIAAHTIR